MPMDVGLRAVLQPEFDDRETEKEVGNLKDRLESLEEVDIDLEGDTKGLEKQLQQLSVDTGISDAVSGTMGREQGGRTLPATDGGGQSIMDTIMGAAAGSDLITGPKKGGLAGAMGGGATAGAMGGAAAAGGGALVGVALGGAMAVGILKGVQEMASFAPRGRKMVEMFGMAMDLFFRPFGDLIGSALMPYAEGALKAMAKFNRIYREEGLMVAVSWMADSILEKIATPEGLVTAIAGLGGAAAGGAAGAKVGAAVGGMVGGPLGAAVGGGIGLGAGALLGAMGLGGIGALLSDEITDALGGLDFGGWGEYISNLTWGDFLDPVTWHTFIHDMFWEDFVVGLYWETFIVGLVWDTFIVDLFWDTFVIDLYWDAFVKDLIWGGFIVGLNWEEWLNPLNWPSYIVDVYWGEFIIGLVWGDFIKGLLWDKFIENIVWEAFIKDIIWEAFINDIIWDAFINDILWDAFIDDIIWGIFINEMLWGTFVDFLKWTGFIDEVDWDTWIPKVDWGKWLSGLNPFSGGGGSSPGRPSQTGGAGSTIGVAAQHGRIVRSPTEALIGEGGQDEAVVPLSRFESMLSQERSAGMREAEIAREAPQNNTRAEGLASVENRLQELIRAVERNSGPTTIELNGREVMKAVNESDKEYSASREILK